MLKAINAGVWRYESYLGANDLFWKDYLVLVHKDIINYDDLFWKYYLIFMCKDRNNYDDSFEKVTFPLCINI